MEKNSDYTGLVKQARPSNVYDDLLETLEYFGHPDFLTTSADLPSSVPPISEPEEEEDPSFLPLPYQALRLPPLTTPLWELPEPAIVTLDLECDPLEDLGAIRIERWVASRSALVTSEQLILKKLFSRNPHPKTRQSIEQLLDQGVLPSVIWKLQKIRKRCRSLFLELNRLYLFGRRNSASRADTVSWSLAHKLHQAGIRERSQLFKYFSDLCHRFHFRDELRRQFVSVLHLADRLLPHFSSDLGTPDAGRVSQLTAPTWRWQDPRSWSCSPRQGFPLRADLNSAIREEQLPARRFQTYRRARVGYAFSPETWNLEEAVTLLTKAILHESPIRFERLKTMVEELSGETDNLVNTRRAKFCLYELLRLGKVIQRGPDFWYYRDSPRSDRLGRVSFAGQHLPLNQASIYDLGRVLEIFLQSIPEEEAIHSLGCLWSKETSEATARFLQHAWRDYQQLYSEGSTCYR